MWHTYDILHYSAHMTQALLPLAAIKYWVTVQRSTMAQSLLQLKTSNKNRNIGAFSNLLNAVPIHQNIKSPHFFLPVIG